MRAPYPGVAPSASTAPEGGFMFSSSRAVLICTAVIAAAACTDAPPAAAPPIFGVPPPAPEFSAVAAMLGRPLPRLSAAQRLRFDAGRAVFATVFTPTTGLGPLFNAVSCASCHEVPVVGGGGNNDPAEGSEDVEVHATAFHGGQCDDLAAVGGPVFQKQVTPALADALHITAEAIPAAATDSGHRTTPDLFGFGLLDAVPEREILAHADPLDRNGDGISRRPNRTADARAGRFARKQPCDSRRCGRSPICCCTIWVPISPTSVWGRRCHRNSAPSHSWDCGSQRLSCMTAARRQSRTRSHCTAERASGRVTGSCGCRPLSATRCCGS